MGAVERPGGRRSPGTRAFEFVLSFTKSVRYIESAPGRLDLQIGNTSLFSCSK